MSTKPKSTPAWWPTKEDKARADRAVKQHAIATELQILKDFVAELEAASEDDDLPRAASALATAEHAAHMIGLAIDPARDRMARIVYENGRYVRRPEAVAP